MAILVKFAVHGMTASAYDDVIAQLASAGAGAPKGRLYHVAFGSKDDLQVIDVYDSPASFEAFGRTLVPILTERKIRLGAPEVLEVHNEIRG